VPTTDELLSISAVAKRLGVSRSMVWRMIADGYLDAESVQLGRRLITRVEIPSVLPSEPSGTPARSRTMRLQEQVDQLTEMVEVLTERLVEARQEQGALLAELRRSVLCAEAVLPDGDEVEFSAAQQPTADPFPAGVTARPNPMTHPATVFNSWRLTSREEALAPLRALLQPESRGPWWQRLAPGMR
jgi:excisionase family DNA binding protein